MTHPMTHFHESDAELRDGPPCDLHSLRQRDASLDALSAEIQHAAATRAAADFLAKEDAGALLRLVGTKAVLVTGGAGYLGAALVLTLRELGVPVLGLDVVQAPTVDLVASVADSAALRGCGQACGAVLHTAALHATHASSWHTREFVSTNVGGAENALALGLPMVHTSTTSLTITARVKQREKAGELVWIDDASQRPDRRDPTVGAALDAPRNKYGITKLAAEQRCLAAAATGADVCILRAPRFFPEDTLEETELSPENTKVNELLGRRCALVDVVSAHLHALSRVRQLRGAVLTLAAPLPVGLASRVQTTRGSSEDAGPGRGAAKEAAQHLRAAYPYAEALFASRGWQLPDALTRVYDSSAAVRELCWTPRVTFDAVLQAMQQAPSPCADLDEGLAGSKHAPEIVWPRVDLSEVCRGAF